MRPIPFLYSLPIGVTFVMVLAIILAALELGFRIGVRRRHGVEDEEEGASGLTQNSLFALLGLLLAFTYGCAITRYEARKQSVIAEANALGTAFLRCGLLPNSSGEELQRALLDYARTRVFTIENAGTAEVAGMTYRRTMEAQARLWPVTERLVKAAPAGPVEVALVTAVNDVIDMNTSRTAAIFDYLPHAVFWTLQFVASVAFAVSGYCAGISGRLCRWRMTAFAFVLATVMVMITDFDRPLRGFVRVHQQPLSDTIAEMEATLARR